MRSTTRYCGFDLGGLILTDTMSMKESGSWNKMAKLSSINRYPAKIEDIKKRGYQVRRVRITWED